MTPSRPIAGDDLAQTSQILPRWRQLAAWLGLFAAVYAANLFATLPADLVLHPVGPIRVGGTIWQGHATLPGRHRFAWAISPWRSAVALAAAATWELTGPETELKGSATLAPGGLSIENASGRVSTALIRAFDADLPLLCDVEARVDLRSVHLSRARFAAEADVRTELGSCPTSQGASRPLPPLELVLAGAGDSLAARLMPAGDPATVLAEASLGPTGQLVLELKPAAAAVIPGLPGGATPSGSFRLETTIALP